MVLFSQMLQVFESHAEYLGPALFDEFALPYIKQIQQRVRARVDVPMVKLLNFTSKSSIFHLHHGYFYGYLLWTIAREPTTVLYYLLLGIWYITFHNLNVALFSFFSRSDLIVRVPERWTFRFGVTEDSRVRYCWIGLDYQTGRCTR